MARLGLLNKLQMSGGSGSMAIRTSGVLEDAVPRIPIAELTSGAASFERTPPTHRSEPRVRHEGIQFDLDNYQIALVPFQNGQDRASGKSPRGGGTSQLLLLPLTWKEFLTRVRGELRGSTSLEENTIVRFGRVSIDPLSMEVRRSDRPVSLTAKEFQVLKFFVSNPNRVLSRDQLLNEVWGYDNYPCTRTVDNHVLKLRQKLEPEPADPVHFRTVHRIGYKFIP
jgi:DNA-binding winged helix-turn-helix (wHTH) protein